MPVEKYAEEYKMDHKRRGKAVIFNHEFFNYLPHRQGSEVDVRSLRRTYEALGFEVIIHSNFKYAEIEKAIIECKFKQVVLN